MAGIFKAYDIRGIVDRDLNETKAFLIGRGLAEKVFHGQSPIVVSRDMRTHSPRLAQQLIRGLRSGGCEVVDIGLAATPMNYWANIHHGSRGSVTVTASHNGPEYNGFKVSGEKAIPIDYISGLNAVEAFVNRALEAGESLPDVPEADAGEPADPLDAYLQFMDAFVAPGSRPLKIAVDTGNGMGGLFLPGFFTAHENLTSVPLYWELDGSFPNHEADPLKPENLLDLQAAVVQNGCDFGAAFDGDADRCMFVDDRGNAVSSDRITALIAQAILKKHPGTSILYDLRSSHVVPEWVRQHGGTPVRGRVGHSFMKRLMKAEKARFGGELSGHYYFADCFDTDSGLMALIQIINILQDPDFGGGRTLSQLLEPLNRYQATGEINFKVSDVEATIKGIEEYYTGSAKTDHLDGLTVELEDWWFNLRSSNTEPLLRLNLEAASEAERDVHFGEVKTLIERLS